MCGIVGYAGKQQAAPILLDGLSKLEYRGYDSAGLCIFSDHHFEIAKAKGRLAALREITNNGESVPGVIGIGHTRWATHGAPSLRIPTLMFPPMEKSASFTTASSKTIFP